MQGSVVEGLSQTAKSGLQWEIKLSSSLTIHNTGISFLLSKNMWILFLKNLPIARREISD